MQPRQPAVSKQHLSRHAPTRALCHACLHADVLDIFNWGPGVRGMGPSRTYRPYASDPWSAEALRRERQQAQERQEQQRQARQAAAAAARARAAAAAARKQAGHWSQQEGASLLGFSPVRSAPAPAGFHISVACLRVVATMSWTTWCPSLLSYRKVPGSLHRPG